MGKLVRDRIPEIIEKGGGKPLVRRLSGDELIKA
jgi:predicted house-cleaning noncanonical NTP pyrophosphatase (MazG superfamily)